MGCPFLKETEVEYCELAAIRKLIPRALSRCTDEKCSSAEYATCAAFAALPAAGVNGEACPYLRESLMQYCGAAPVPKFVPYSEPPLSRCGSGAYCYCEVYLTMAPVDSGVDGEDNILAPEGLRYSGNHMWLDVSSEGICHAGIDALLSRALGKVDRISYVWNKGRRRPTAILTVAGCDLQIVFPNEMLLTGCNRYLRADPSRLTAEPYTGGWLFEGTALAETADDLLDGEAAQEWMEREQRSVNEFLRQWTAPSGEPIAPDGGLFAKGVARLLNRDRMLELFHEFFSPYVRERDRA